MPIITATHGLSLTTKRLVKYIDGEFGLDGIQVASVLYAVAAGSLLSNLPAIGTSGDSHPLFGATWKAFRYRWRHHDRISSALVFLQVDFLNTVSTAIQEEEADSVAGEESIASHPEFLQTAGGLGIAGNFPEGKTVNPITGEFLGTPREGVRFEDWGQNKFKERADYNTEVGKFICFLPGFQLAGVNAVGLERYYAPRGTYTRSYSDTVKPSLAGVGKTVSAPSGAPTLASGFTWLRMRIGYRKLGFVYRITEGFQAGRWNAAIYPAE